MKSKTKNDRTRIKSLKYQYGGLTSKSGIYLFFYNSNDINFEVGDAPSVDEIYKILSFKAWSYKLYIRDLMQHKLNLIVNRQYKDDQIDYDVKIINEAILLKKVWLCGWEKLDKVFPALSEGDYKIIIYNWRNVPTIDEYKKWIYSVSFDVKIYKEYLIRFINSVFLGFSNYFIHTIEGKAINSCVVIEINQVKQNKILFKLSNEKSLYEPMKLTRFERQLCEAIINRNVIDKETNLVNVREQQRIEKGLLNTIYRLEKEKKMTCREDYYPRENYLKRQDLYIRILEEKRLNFELALRSFNLYYTNCDWFLGEWDSISEILQHQWKPYEGENPSSWYGLDTLIYQNDRAIKDGIKIFHDIDSWRWDYSLSYEMPPPPDDDDVHKYVWGLPIYEVYPMEDRDW